MKYSDYIKMLEALKLTGENRVIGIIPKFEDLAYEALAEWIDTSLDVRKGMFAASDETVNILNEFDAAFLKTLNGFKFYKSAVSDLVKDLPKLGNLMQDFQVGVNNIDWAKANVGPTQRLVTDEIIKAYTDNGLNKEFVQPLRNMLYQNIVAGTNVKEAKQVLKDYIKSPEGKKSKINRYLTQTSQQAVDSYTGAVNKKLMATFDYPFMQMSGSLIKTSSKQCVKSIDVYKGVLTKELWEKEIEALAKDNGLIDGTTWENLPFNKLHWSCRHEFTPTMTNPKGETLN